MKKIITLFTLVVALVFNVNAQEDDLLSMVGDPEAVHGPVYATFKGTRLINFHTIEVPGERTPTFALPTALVLSTQEATTSGDWMAVPASA